MEILELIYKISELKILLDGFIAAWTMQLKKKKNSESEEMAIETVQAETQRKLWWGKK